MIPRTQKAAQYDPKSKKVVINTIPIPEPVHREILIRTVAASLCHSEIMAVEGQLDMSTGEATTIGHEAVGQVISVGSTAAARGCKKGDFVGFINAANNHAQSADLATCAEFTAKHKISSPSRYFKLEQINRRIETMQQEKMGGYRLVFKFDGTQETSETLNGNGA